MECLSNAIYTTQSAALQMSCGISPGIGKEYINGNKVHLVIRTHTRTEKSPQNKQMLIESTWQPCLKSTLWDG